MLEFLQQLEKYSSPAFMPWLGGSASWLVYAVFFFVGSLIMIAWFAAMAVIWTYGERRIAGFIQGRLGPNRIGPQGMLQPIVDGIKLLFKEDIIPKVASRSIYIAAPLLVFVGAFMPFAALPFSERLVVANMDLGIYFILAFEAVEVIGIIMAGWGPGSKWSLYGGMRLAAQMLSYEVPMGVCVLIIVLLSGSLNFVEIVNWQSENWVFGWAIFRSPAAFVACFLFYISALASTKRAPFDLPEAESELVAGFHTEYSGIRFAFFFMAEYASMYLVCAMTVILFLGGWYAPFPMPEVPLGASFAERWMDLVKSTQGYVSGTIAVFTDGVARQIIWHELIGATNLVLKSFLLYFVMVWIRWTLPRIRIDQVIYICLKVLLPISIVCLVWALFQVAW